MRDVIEMRDRAKTLRSDAERLDAEGKKAFATWQSKGAQSTSKTNEATRLEVAADMIEQANEIAAGMRDLPSERGRASND